MSPIKWRNRKADSPRTNLAQWAEGFFNEDAGLFNRRWANEEWLPAVNVQETDSSFDLEVAAPGMKKEDFMLEVNKGVLSIRAEQQSESEDKTEHYTRKEFDYRSFNRSFWLPENVDVDSIKANYKDGILEISVPKTEIEATEPSKIIKIA